MRIHFLIQPFPSSPFPSGAAGVHIYARLNSIKNANYNFQ